MIESNKKYFWGPVVWLAACLVYVGSAAFSILHFHLWSQVLYLDEIGLGLDPYAIILQKNTLRYFLVWPIFALRDSFGMDADRLFSVLVSFLMLCTAYFVAKFSVLLMDKPRKFWTYLYLDTAFFMALSWFMNGRLAFAFAGIALIQLTLLEKTKGRTNYMTLLIKLIFGWCLCTVSSGMMVVATTVIYTWLLVYLGKGFGTRETTLGDVAACLMSLLFLYLLYPVLYISVSTEINYYNGDLIQMLTHGLGWFFLKIDIVGLAIIMLVYIPLIRQGIRLWKDYPIYRLSGAVIVLSLAFGLFGFSTLLTCLPMLIGLANLWAIGFFNKNLIRISLFEFCS